MKIHKCGECCQFKNCKCKEWNRDVSAERTACKLAYVNDYFGDHEIKKVMEVANTETKTNPLEKLANELGMFADFNKDADRVNGYVLTKAKLIIARMSKVRNHECSTEPIFFDCKEAVRDIREIAEGKGTPVEYQPNSGGFLVRADMEKDAQAEVKNLRECLQEAVNFHCGKCINKGGLCNSDCLFDKWKKALKEAK